MAHQVINNKVVVDWTTGDNERDRLVVLAAYRDFIKEIQSAIISEADINDVSEILRRWDIDTDNQIDNVPRVWISRP